MQTLKSILDQAMLIWNDSTAAARFGLAMLAVIFVGAIVGVGIWSAQPNYIDLARELDPAKASKMIDALDAEGIAYQVRGSGSIVKVDASDLPRARIAAGKLGINTADAELESVSPWMDPVSQQETFRRNLERQLESTIQRLKSIERADVHLSIPEKQAFIREKRAVGGGNSGNFTQRKIWRRTGCRRRVDGGKCCRWVVDRTRGNSRHQWKHVRNRRVARSLEQTGRVSSDAANGCLPVKPKSC